MLQHFDPTCKSRVETDAPGFGVAAVLTQLMCPPSTMREAWYPIAFWLRKMIPAESNYESHDAELLAIVEAFREWRHYLGGAQYSILSLLT